MSKVAVDGYKYRYRYRCRDRCMYRYSYRHRYSYTFRIIRNWHQIQLLLGKALGGNETPLGPLRANSGNVHITRS